MRLRNEMFRAWANPEAYQELTWGRKESVADADESLYDDDDSDAEPMEASKEARAILDRAAANLWGASLTGSVCCWQCLLLCLLLFSVPVFLAASYAICS